MSRPFCMRSVVLGLRWGQLFLPGPVNTHSPISLCGQRADPALCSCGPLLHCCTEGGRPGPLGSGALGPSPPLWPVLHTLGPCHFLGKPQALLTSSLLTAQELYPRELLSEPHSWSGFLFEVSSLLSSQDP